MRPGAQFLAGLLALFVLNGCAGFFARPVPSLPPEADQALSLLKKQQQAQPEGFKGLGKVLVQAGATSQTMSLAWLVKLPDKMRFEVLAPTGHSLLTVAADGRYIYFLSHTSQGRLQKHRANNVNLERITGVPVEKEDLLSLLAGKFPVRPYDSAAIRGNGRDGYVLDLKRRWRGVVESVYFDGALETPYKVELIDGWKDKTSYSATIIRWQQVDGFKVPGEIVLDGGGGLTARLMIRRYWVEADIADEQFMLTDDGG